MYTNLLLISSLASLQIKLTLILLPVKFGKQIKAAHFPVYSSDVYRSAYWPNTQPEEFFFHTNSSEYLMQNAVVHYDDINQEAARVQNLLSVTDSPALENKVITVRCPNGWSAVGPFCTTLSLAQPYTQCPLDHGRREHGQRIPLVPNSDTPGLCERQDVTGVLLKCPEGFTFYKEVSNTTSSLHDVVSIECRSHVVYPYSFLSESPRRCPTGTVPNGAEGCVGIQRIGPDITCPDGYTTDSTIINPFNILDKQRLTCKKTVNVKGKLWCPKGYHMSGELFPDKAFGTVIPTQEMAKNLEQSYVPSIQASCLKENGWTDSSRYKQLDAVVCFQVLTALWSNCNHLRCITPELKQIHRTLMNWAYHRLQTDGSYALYWGIPSGRDYKYTTSVFLPYFFRNI